MNFLNFSRPGIDIHPDVKAGYRHIKTIKVWGVQVAFRLEPAARGGSILYSMLAVRGLGTVAVTFNLPEHKFGDKLKVSLRERAKAAIIASTALAEFRSDPDVLASASIIAKASKTPDIKRIVNELVMISSLEAGILVIPETGYDELGMNALRAKIGAPKPAVAPNAPVQPPSPPPPEEAPQAAADPKKTYN